MKKSSLHETSSTLIVEERILISGDQNHDGKCIFSLNKEKTSPVNVFFLQNVKENSIVFFYVD
jgi:hypothetical protein